MSRPRLGLIAYEYPPLVGGMATYARALARHMLARGYEVHLFSNADAASEEGAEVYPILTTDLAQDLPLLARYDMDLWHSVNFGYAPLACVRRPFVLSAHGNDFLKPWVRPTFHRVPGLWRTAGWFDRPAVRRAVYGPALRCVDQVLTCSGFSARLLRRAYPSVGSIGVVANGVDDAFLRPLPDAVSPGRRDHRLITVCNLDTANRRKNVDGVIRAMAMVGERLGLEYLVVGDGSYRAELERLARRLGVGERVRFVGRLSDRGLREAYASSALFVLVPRPEPGDVEGFGIVYLEAAALGTPALAGRWGGAAEAVFEGVSGFFVDEPTPDAVADGMTRFFTGQVRFDAGHVRAHAARYTWANVLEPVERVYERLLARGRTRGETEGRRDGGGNCELRIADCGFVAGDSIRNSQSARHGEACRSRAIRNSSAGQLSPWSAWLAHRPIIPQSGEGGRALLISYAFPPAGGSGVQRPAKLAKHLPEFGWTVEVLTAGHDRFPWRDDSVLADVPADCRVHRVAGDEPAAVASRLVGALSLRGVFAQPHDAGPEAAHHCGLRIADCGFAWGNSIRNSQFAIRNSRRPAVPLSLCPPLRWIEDRVYWRLIDRTAREGLGDGETLWTRAAVRAALRRHRVSPFDIVISTGPPHVAHEVARRIAWRTGLPWVADVRDPLVSDFDRDATDAARVEAARGLERAILNEADLVVTTCPSLAEEFNARGPRRPSQHVRAILNGFDRDDLVEHAELLRRPACKPRDCTFVALGSFYGRREIARLVDPLKRVLEAHPEWQGRVRLVIAGTLDAEQQREWTSDRPAWLSLRGYLDHASAIRLAAESACAIVIVPDCQHGRLSIPGKTFELLALPTHVLGLVPEGSDTERVIADAGASTLARFEDAGGVASAMEVIIERYLAGRLDAERDWARLDVYDRRHVAAAFAQAMNAVCDPETTPSEIPAERAAPAPLEPVGLSV